MTTYVLVKDYLNNPNLKDLSVPSSLFIKPDYYTNKAFKNINNINDINDSVIDENKYKILIDNISHSENLTPSPRSRPRQRVKSKSRSKSRSKSKKRTIKSDSNKHMQKRRKTKKR
tara:strand:- start:3168 stop:3515 length:348 start_codon:yes stop_codon:yes gene_type:complete